MVVVAVFGDAHAHAEALDTVIGAAEACGVQELWSLGDMTGGGPDPEHVVARTRERCAVALMADADTIQDRELDIRFHDRTNYDLKVANMISDYLILYGQVKNLALKHLSKYGQEVRDSFNKELEKEVLDKPGTKSEKRSKKEEEGKRTYRDLIEGRFDIAKVVYVDRKDDGSTIFGKAPEFSESTIKDLFKNGYKEALDTVDASYIQS